MISSPAAPEPLACSSAAPGSGADLLAAARNERIVVGHRAARVVFGSSLIAGAMALVIRALLVDVVGASAIPAAWEIVAMTWTVAFASSVVAARVARTLVWERPRMATDDESLVASITLPAAGLAVFLPITIHMPFALFAAGTHGFDQWCTWSVALVGHAHVVLAVLAAHRAASLIERRREEPASTPVSIYVITILVSAVPFGLFYVVPPFLVAVTGLPIIALLPVMERLLARERALLGVR
jgi:hypothetical protein